MAFPDIADSKKVQTLINVLARAAKLAKDADDIVDVCRTAFAVADPDVTGTPLEGNLALVNTWAADLKAVADSAIATGMIAAARPGHKEEY